MHEQAQLRKHYLWLCDQRVRERLAKRIALEGGEAGVQFLLDQARSRGRRAEAARRALAGSGAAAALIQALERAPDEQGLILALPRDLPRPLAQRLLALLPRVGDERAVRHLVQRILEALPESRETLITMRDACNEPLRALAAEVGLAAAGDADELQALCRSLGAEPAPDAVRIILSCRPVAESAEGKDALARLLSSETGADRAFALQVIEVFGLTAFAPDVARAYLYDEHEYASGRALLALPIASQHLSGQELIELLGPACQCVAPPRDAPLPASAAAAQTHRRASIWSRAEALVRLCPERPNEALAKLLASLASGAGVLMPYLMTDEPDAAVLTAYEAVAQVQRGLIRLLWEVDRACAAACCRGLAGVICREHVRRVGRRSAPADAEAVLAELAARARRAARMRLARVLGEPRQTRARCTLAWMARDAEIRMSLIRCLRGHEGLAGLLMTALRLSREREVQARQQAREAVGEDECTAYQAVADEQFVLQEWQRELLSGLMNRLRRAYGPQPVPESVVDMLAEQVLQTDLLALLAAEGGRVVGLTPIVECIGSTSALVREAAFEAVGHCEAPAGALVDALQRSSSEETTAHLLETLRCLGDPRALAHARDALGTTHELLQASAVRYLGAFGGLDDFARIGDANLVGELPRLAGLLALAGLRGPGADLAQTLVTCLTRPNPAEALLARRMLLECPRVAVLAALEPCIDSDDAWVRVAARRAHDLVASGVPAAPARGGTVVPVCGDLVLGQTLLTSGALPWQWGLPGLTAARLRLSDQYVDLLLADETLAEAWEDWVLTGLSPWQLLRHLHSLVVEGGPDAEPASAMALDALGPDIELVWSGFCAYHDLTGDADDEARLLKVAAKAFRMCTRQVLAQVLVPNPSHAARVAEAMLREGRPAGAPDTLVIAFVCLLKRLLNVEFVGAARRPAGPTGDDLRGRVEREWERLQRFQDIYYGFTVEPAIPLRELGLYCRDRKARPQTRTQINSYLGYLATTAPVLIETQQQAVKALTLAFGPRLRAAARRVARTELGRKRPGTHPTNDDEQAVLAERAAQVFERLRVRFVEALRDFDVLYLEPRPILPLGTLDMAWEPLRNERRRRRSLYPERHLSFANLLGKLVRKAARETLEDREPMAGTVSLQRTARNTDGEEEADEPGRSPEETRELEERLLDDIDEGKASNDIADASLAPPERGYLGAPVHGVEVDGMVVNCVDIQGVAQLLRRSVESLRRYEKAGSIRFVRDRRGRRHLPLADIDRARIAVRKPGEWARALGVSTETVRLWMQDVPEGIGPQRLEELLLEQKARKRKLKR